MRVDAVVGVNSHARIFEPVRALEMAEALKPFRPYFFEEALRPENIAAMAEAHYVTVAPHNPMGPVATAVNIHFAVWTPRFLILEYSPDDVPPRPLRRGEGVGDEVFVGPGVASVASGRYDRPG